MSQLTFNQAIRYAIGYGRVLGQKQHVYKHPLIGWTWTTVHTETHKYRAGIKDTRDRRLINERK